MGIAYGIYCNRIPEQYTGSATLKPCVLHLLFMALPPENKMASSILSNHPSPDTIALRLALDNPSWSTLFFSWSQLNALQA